MYAFVLDLICGCCSNANTHVDTPVEVAYPKKIAWGQLPSITYSITYATSPSPTTVQLQYAGFGACMLVFVFTIRMHNTSVCSVCGFVLYQQRRHYHAEAAAAPPPSWAASGCYPANVSRLAGATVPFSMSVLIIALPAAISNHTDGASLTQNQDLFN